MSSNKIKKIGKASISQGTTDIVINFPENFSVLPSIKITSNSPTNIYMSEVTVSSFKVHKNIEENIEFHYIAIEGDADDLPANEEVIIVTIQPDPSDSSIDRFYFNGSYPLSLNADIGKLYKFDISGISSQNDLQFGFGQGDGHWDPNYKIMGSSSADEYAQGLENSLIDYKQLDQNLPA